jgi:NADP-dependent 3-hydroxy acid dehydrogenase YdfG
VTGVPLAGQTALVTGASRGIGAAVALRLARAGARVQLLARSADVLVRMARELGGNAWPADLEDDGELWEVLEDLTVALGGPPDLVVNAAGVFDMATMADTSIDLFDRALGANLRGPFLVIRALLPAMLTRGSGSIVTVGSVAGHQPFPGNAAYSASKFGVRGMHEVLSEELRGTGVRATLVEPGATATSIWDAYGPDERADLPSRAAMLSVDDVAGAVLFAATRPAGVRVPLLRIEKG